MQTATYQIIEALAQQIHSTSCRRDRGRYLAHHLLLLIRSGTSDVHVQQVPNEGVHARDNC